MKQRFRLSAELRQLFDGELEPVYVGTKHADFRISDRIYTFSTNQLEPVGPPEPEPGVYRIGNALAVREPGAASPNHWSILGYASQLPSTWLINWQQVWQVLGSTTVKIIPLVPQDQSDEFAGTVPIPLKVHDAQYEYRGLEIARSTAPGVIVRALYFSGRQLDMVRKLNRADTIRVIQALTQLLNEK
jgi:hypothetical protein